jgi:hypothetical protein
MKSEKIRYPSLAPVKPHECVLALAIPLTRARFLADLRVDAAKDFAKRFAEPYKDLRVTDEYRWEKYEPYIQVVEKCCSEVDKLGAAVRRDVRRADLTTLCREYRVVTLVTHNRRAEIAPDDILDARGLLDTLRHPQTDVQALLRAAFAERAEELLYEDYVSQLTTEELRAVVALVVNEIVNAAQALYDKPPASARSDVSQSMSVTPTGLTRLTCELEFPEQIRPALAIEFADRLCAVGELLDAIPLDFNGTLDLTVCNSVMPAGPIMRWRENCLVVSNRYQLDLEVALTFYGQALIELKAKPQSFAAAITKVRLGKE